MEGQSPQTDMTSVVRSSIGDIPVCIGGEVDCVDGEYSPSHYATAPTHDWSWRLIDAAVPGTPHPGLDKCMELKTNGPVTNPSQERTFHK